MLKRKLNQQKVLAHRKKVEGKSTKSATKKDKVPKTLLDDILADKTDGFISSHLLLKAKAITGSATFSSLSRAEIHCLFRIYNMKFVPSKSKTALCELLSEAIKAQDSIPCPNRIQAAHFSKIKENHKNKSQLDDFPDDDDSSVPVSTAVSRSTAESTTDTTTNDNATVPPNVTTAGNKQRRARFKPAPAQIAVLKEDHSRKPNREINKRRADEFGVHITQIETWHKRQRQQSRKNTGNMHIQITG